MAGILTTLGFRDSKGKIGKVRFFVAAGTPANEATQAGAITTAIESLTNAQIATAHGAFNLAPTSVVYGAQSTYEAAEDKAVFTFQDAQGQIHRLQVPAPLLTIFLGDGETVDPANTAVAAFLTAFVGVASNAHGLALTTFIGGIRQRRKLQRKINIFTLTPIFGPEE